MSEHKIAPKLRPLPDRINHLLGMDVGPESFAFGARMVLMEVLDHIAALEREIAELRAKDGCQVCGGSRGGVKGNENVVDGVVTCDYCHAELRQRVES